MSNKQYTPAPPPAKVSEWDGRLVRTKRDMRNGYVGIPAGTILTIDGPATSKKHLTGESCPHCGIAPKITLKGDRQSFLSDVEFVDEVPGSVVEGEGFIDRDKIINSMCYTWRHDYGLLSEGEKASLFAGMAQIFDNDIAPHLGKFLIEDSRCGQCSRCEFQPKKDGK